MAFLMLSFYIKSVNDYFGIRQVYLSGDSNSWNSCFRLVFTLVLSSYPVQINNMLQCYRH